MGVMERCNCCQPAVENFARKLQEYKVLHASEREQLAIDMLEANGSYLQCGESKLTCIPLQIIARVKYGKGGETETGM